MNDDENVPLLTDERTDVVRCECFRSFSDRLVSMNGRLFDLLNGNVMIVPHFNVNNIPVLLIIKFAVVFFPI